MNHDERRSARLLFAPELASGALTTADVESPAVRRAVRSRRLPRLVALAQRAAVKYGRLTYERAVLEPLMEARRSVLGDDAHGPPRLLVRVDEFPHYLAHGAPRFERVYASEHYLVFHEAFAKAGVPYLLAVSPRISQDPLDPDDREWRPLDEFERDVLARLAADGVQFGMHGLSHRTRRAEPSRHSEIAGLPDDHLRQLLETSASELGEAGVEATRVFVPPYNRFDPAQYDTLAERFDLVCGGPENVRLMGYQRTPLWLGEAVYMPAYWPFYGDVESLAPALGRLVELQAPVWVPVALHWGWEFENDWATLPELARLLAPHARPWSEFFAEMQASSLDV